MVLLPTVAFGGTSILTMLIGDPGVRGKCAPPRPLACGSRPRGSIARSVAGNATLRGRDRPLQINETCGAAFDPGGRSPTSRSLLSLCSVAGRHRAEPSDLPGLRRCGLSGCGAPDSGCRPYPVESVLIGRSLARPCGICPPVQTRVTCRYGHFPHPRRALRKPSRIPLRTSLPGVAWHASGPCR